MVEATYPGDWLRDFAERYRNGTLKDVRVDYEKLHELAVDLDILTERASGLPGQGRIDPAIVAPYQQEYPPNGLVLVEVPAVISFPPIPKS